MGIDGFGGPDLAEQLIGAARIQQRQQLLPRGQLEQVDQPAGAVAEQDRAVEVLAS